MHKIQTAQVSDIPLIRELTFQVWPQTYASIISKEQIDFMLDRMYSASSLAKQMSDGAEFLIVYENDIPVGFASYQQMEPVIYKLHKLYVLGSQQGRGTGRFIIDHIVSEIKQQGGTALQLQVNRHNNAKDFYHKLGFIVIEKADFDIGHGYFMNDYVMEKIL